MPLEVACLQKLAKAYFVPPEAGTPGISGKLAPGLSASACKRFIGDFREVWVGSVLVLFCDVDHGENLSSRAEWVSLCLLFPSGEQGAIWTPANGDGASR